MAFISVLTKPPFPPPSPLLARCGLTSQSHRQSRKPLSLLNGLTLWWKWLGSVRVCERRVTDGINHHNDGVRGGESGCWAVTDGTVLCWRGRMDEKMWWIRQTLGTKAGNNGDVRDGGNKRWLQGSKAKSETRWFDVGGVERQRETTDETLKTRWEKILQEKDQRGESVTEGERERKK